MKVRSHPRIGIVWPPVGHALGAPAAGDDDEDQPESQSIIRAVQPATDKSFTMSGEFKGNPFLYTVRTKHAIFAERLAGEFSKHLGETLKQLGDLDLDF
jgi:hypothetical protein